MKSIGQIAQFFREKSIYRLPPHNHRQRLAVEIARRRDILGLRTFAPQQIAVHDFSEWMMSEIRSNAVGRALAWCICNGTTELIHQRVGRHARTLVIGALPAAHAQIGDIEFRAPQVGTRSLCRQRLARTIRDELEAEGYAVAPLNFNPPSKAVGHHIDAPPYASSPHLKIELEGYVATSTGLIVTKPYAINRNTRSP